MTGKLTSNDKFESGSIHFVRLKICVIKCVDQGTTNLRIIQQVDFGSTVQYFGDVSRDDSRYIDIQLKRMETQANKVIV